MGNLALRINNLGKQYLRGVEREKYFSFRDAIAGMVKAPFRRLRRLSGAPSSEGEMFWALRDVDLEVEHGDVMGIIGLNGAGKSTLLKIISRVTAPTTGEVELYGRIGSLLEVGTGFHPELTGRENIYLNGCVLGMRKAEIDRKFDEIASFSGIEQFLDTPVKRYSSGMYVRLAFSVAAHLNSDILLVDEVLAVGDAEFQKKCLGKMEDVAKEGRTVLFVSHNLNAIEELCQSVTLLEAGAVKESSSDVRSVIKAYLFGSGDIPAASQWENPGKLLDTDWFKPLSLALTDRSGTPLVMPVRNDAEIWVRIECEIKQSNPSLNVGYAVYDEDGHFLYWSFSTDGPVDAWPRLAPGRCSLRSRVPSRFLNEGFYRIELIASLHLREWLSEPGKDAPSVILNIQGGLSDSPYWMERRAGLLAPVIEWQIVE